MLIRSRGMLENEMLRVGDVPIPSEDSFFFRAFNTNIKTAESVLNTKYLQSMQKGILPPDNYGELTVLDAYYCYRGADTYNTSLCNIDKTVDLELYELMSKLHNSYREYNKTFFDDWHVRTSESVNATQTFIDYSEHEHHVACSKHSVYTLVAMLPCYYLWYWFSNEMLKNIKTDNLYYDWVVGCHSASSAYVIGNFFEEWIKSGKEFDDNMAIKIYSDSMSYELQVFTEAFQI